ncbi:Lrp/AsnC family transcriptional regulator [Veronia pacifica]|uniref:ArsR family transcriptional regulator n=1 Tax=Veronia pacifica TaxID=1080227 RepID=A0A1C3EBE3_9GAMM|nr:ArsR family transcriptional regulator [Veronia pacifica]
MKLDRIDKNILRQLQRNADISNLSLAETVGLSPAACFKRVRRLKAQGVIKSLVAIVDQKILGPCLHMLVEVKMERDKPQLHANFLRRVQRTIEVKECFKVTGDGDFVLIIDVPDMEHYEALCEDIFYADENVKNFRTMISMNKVKYSTEVQIP